MALMSGPVIFIDDELEVPTSEAFALLQEIQASGRPVAVSTDVPAVDARDAWFEQWSTLAFVVIDWDLSQGSMGSTGGALLSAYERTKLYDFIQYLMSRLYCPVFIVSAEDVEDIRRQLLEKESFVDEAGELDARIAVFPKSVVMGDLVQKLTEWVEQSPALAAIRAWEREFELAKNGFLLDLHDVEPDWPVYIWDAANQDEVDPGFELTSVISTSLLNRFRPVAFDAATLGNYEGELSSRSQLRVSQGRTTVAASRLSPDSVMPGDFFRLEHGELWINVSPACQTVVARAGEDGVSLHLLRAERLGKPSTIKEWRALDARRRNTNSVLVHTLHEEEPYEISFRRARIEKWDSIADARIGRLQQPYVTRIQQLHAAYIQSEGLPRVTEKLYGL